MLHGHMLKAARLSHEAKLLPGPAAHVPNAWATTREDSGHRDGEVSLAVWKPRRTPEPVPWCSLDLHVVD